jgi:hypothetical protein
MKPTREERAEMQENMARRLFSERGGDELIETLATIQGTLVMHQQDVERGMANDNPEKFRWRVSPAVALRLRKERKQLEAEVKALQAEARAEAAKWINDYYGPLPAERAEAQPERQPSVEISRRTAETEAAQNAPIPAAA